MEPIEKLNSELELEGGLAGRRENDGGGDPMTIRGNLRNVAPPRYPGFEQAGCAENS